MERIIKIAVRDRIASADASVYVCGNSDFNISFDFDAEWEEFVHKTARFVYNGTYTDIVFSGNQCTVPVISDTYSFLVGVYAGDLRTTTPARVAATKSILCDTNPPAEPSPDVYSQMVELFNAGLDESRVNANVAESAKDVAVKAQEVTEAAEKVAVASAESAKVSEDNAKASEEEAVRAAENAKADAESAAKSKTDAEKAGKQAVSSAASAETSAGVAYGSASSADIARYQAEQARDAAATHEANAANYAANAEMAQYTANDAANTAQMSASASIDCAHISAQNATAAEESAKAAKESEEMAMSHVSVSEAYSTISSGKADDAAASAELAAAYAEAAEAAKATSLQALDALLMVDTATGKIATLECAAAMPVRALTVNDGVAVETVNIIGKNFFNRDYEKTNTHLGVTFSWDAENQEIVMNGTTTGSGDLKLVEPLRLDWVAGEKYTITVTPVGGTATLNTTETGTNFGWGIFQNNAAKYIRGQLHYTDLNVPYSFTGTAFALDENKHYIFYFQCWKPGTVFTDYRVKVQIERGASATGWEAYRKNPVAFADVQSFVLSKGTNNVFCTPQADITVDYTVDTKLYVDSKFAKL